MAPFVKRNGRPCGGIFRARSPDLFPNSSTQKIPVKVSFLHRDFLPSNFFCRHIFLPLHFFCRRRDFLFFTGLSLSSQVFLPPQKFSAFKGIFLPTALFPPRPVARVLCGHRRADFPSVTDFSAVTGLSCFQRDFPLLKPRRLTEDKTLMPVLQAICRWGHEHLPEDMDPAPYQR